jgi:RHS repeat-associated protein
MPTVKIHPHTTARSRLAKCLAIGLSFLLALPVHAETIIYQHDNSGNITLIGSTTFAYDEQNRITGESGPAKNQTIVYDDNGNRLSDGAGTYTYDLKSNRMLTRRSLAVTLDAAGNIYADGTGRTYTHNQAGQLYQVFQNSILIATYYYDGNSRRTRKVTTANAPQGAQTIFFAYDVEGHLIAELSGTGAPLRTYVWQDNTPLSQIEYLPSRKIYYFNVDHLKIPRSMMDDTGKIVWRWNSDAFGSTLPNEDPDGDGVKVTSNLRFSGQYYDAETGLHYNWHRYYDPSMGQYIEADPAGLAAGTNLYAYSGGNPLTFVDPTGLKLCRVTLPGLGNTSLDDSFIPSVQKWIKLNEAAGIDVNFTEAFRTTAYQKGLAGNPNATTPAKAGFSLHEAGFAVDISWKRLTDAQQDTVLNNADAAGLDWGGDFRKPDPVHFYHDPGKRAKRIRDAQKRNQSGDNCECN